MRWKDRSYGLKRRIVKRFALFPFWLKGEGCWLETFYTVQEHCSYVWYDKRWATEDEYLAWRETLKNEAVQ